MIPKIIHYVWLGGKEIPTHLQVYIDGWKQMMPTWQIMQWTERNVPQEVLTMPYVQDALDAKKYAFASDYVRLWALEQYGGVYLDTDVEVVRTLEELEELSVVRCQMSDVEAFIGFEESLAHLPGTCVVGCEAHCQWVKDMLALYEDLRFKIADCKYDLTTNVQRMGKRMIEGGLVSNGKEQVIEKWGLHVYDFHHFSPITSTRVMRKTKDTFTIHHFAGSWSEKKGKLEVSGQWSNVKNWTITRETINALIQIKRFIKGQQ